MIAALLAVAGWGGDANPGDLRHPRARARNLPALQNVDQLEQATGISGLTYVT